MDFSDRPQCHFLRGLFLPVEVDLFFNKKKNNIRYCLYHSFFKIKALSKDEAFFNRVFQWFVGELSDTARVRKKKWENQLAAILFPSILEVSVYSLTSPNLFLFSQKKTMINK